MAPKFSIVIPTHNRADGRLQRCLNSVMTQTWRDFECIVVDDGSTDGTPELLDSDAHPYSLFKQLRYLRLVANRGRVIARNVGMEAAGGEWICWLDSDDAYDPMYLATFAHYIEQDPDANLWVCGAIVHGVLKDADGKHLVPKWTKIRPAWMPPVNSDGGHDHFGSGKVGTGMFVFKRACLEQTGLMPPWRTCYDIADGVDEWLGYETGYSASRRLCGNPFGDDYCMFRRLTQFYQVHLIQSALYVQYVR